METNIISGNENVNESVLLDLPNESLNVLSNLEVVGEDSAVSVTSSLNRVDVEGSGTIRGESKAIELDRSLDASIVNDGTIDGGNDGIDFVNGSLASGTVLNKGTITSDSRAINIGGNALSLVSILNKGLITTTSDPRNGTVYADKTAGTYFFENAKEGLVDVGEGNNGDAISLEIDGFTRASIGNAGTIKGRGKAIGNNLSSAIRVFRSSDSEERAIFTGNIQNFGLLTAENGAAIAIQNGVLMNGSIINGGEITSANTENGIGILFENGAGFNGEIINTGLINGARDGVNFANGIITNRGTITSASRAVNIDGNFTALVNEGLVTTTSNPRNGTVYANADANNYTIDNRGTIDVGEGNTGDAISLEIGGMIRGSLVNSGLVQGRGTPTDNTPASAVRLFRSADINEVVSFNGNIENLGTLASVGGAAITIEEGVAFNGTIINDGTIKGGLITIDASSAASGVRIVSNGTIDGLVFLSENDDLFDGSLAGTSFTVDGLDGDDIIKGGNGDDFLAGGAGKDTLTGGAGKDQFSFALNDPFVDGTPQSTPSGINILNNPDNITDFVTGEDLLAFAAADFGTDQVRFQKANSTDLSGDSNLVVLLDSFANAGAAATAIADSELNADAGVFVYFNETLGISRAVFSQDLSDGGDISILANLENLTDPGIQGQFSADNFLLV
ncbi:MAG: hypothetical protein AAF378_08230 [Cyanobacteria bacterium P01_A01_bin.84]